MRAAASSANGLNPKKPRPERQSSPWDAEEEAARADFSDGSQDSAKLREIAASQRE